MKDSNQTQTKAGKQSRHEQSVKLICIHCLKDKNNNIIIKKAQNITDSSFQRCIQSSEASLNNCPNCLTV